MLDMGRGGAPQLYSPVASGIAEGSDIAFGSYICCASLGGEYNITKAVGFNITVA